MRGMRSLLIFGIIMSAQVYLYNCVDFPTAKEYQLSTQESHVGGDNGINIQCSRGRTWTKKSNDVDQCADGDADRQDVQASYVNPSSREVTNID